MSRHNGAMPDRGPTSHDIAKAAGVSQTAVSLVLRGVADGRISPEKQASIRAAARHLGYRPNRVAQHLRTGQTDYIGLLIPDVRDPFFASVLRGAQQAAAEKGFSVVMLEGALSVDWGTVAAQALASRLVAAVVVCAPRGEPSPEAVELAGRIVAVDAGRLASLPSVMIDVERGMQLLANHMNRLGHRRIGRLRAGIATETFALRDRAFQEHSRTWAEISAVDTAAYSLDGAVEAAGILLDNADITAIVADTDLLAAGVYRAARARGLAIPTDLSVTGFDDVDVARMLDPQLTTVRVDGEGAGRLGVRTALRFLAHQPLPTELTVHVQLLARGSTGPPRMGDGSRPPSDQDLAARRST